MRTKAITVVAALVAAPTLAQPLFTADERAALGREIRALLLDQPALVAPAFGADMLPPNATGYADEIEADRTLLADLAPQIFAYPVAGPDNAPKLALITAPDCDACTEMQAQLTDAAKAGQLALYTLPLDSEAARALGLDTAPSYVFTDMVVRGDVPAAVLEKYLAKRR